MLRNLGVLSLSLLLAVAAIWYFAELTLIRPINRLVEATRSFGAGDSSVRTGVPHTDDETGQLAQSFDEAMELLQQRDGERRKAETALQLAHAETELFLACIPSILIGLDSAGCITRWNSAAVAAFAISSDDALGRKLEDCGVEWLQPDLRSEIPHWLANTSFLIRTFSYRHKGDTHFLEIGIQPIRQAARASGVILTGNDVTHSKLLEEQLRQAQKLEAVGQLASGIAHEINTPLQFAGDNVRFLKDSWPEILRLLQFLRRMRDESGDSEVKVITIGELYSLWQVTDADYLIEESSSAIGQALEGMERISKIVRAMKEFSHPGNKEKVLVDINHALDNTITVARNEWKYVAEMESQFDPNLSPVPCLAGELNQVLLNLIVNAAQAIADDPARQPGTKGVITVTTSQLKDAVRIAIRDSGPGIPEEIRQRVFEPFFTTKPPGKGTGQGLTLAHSVIVQQHNGQIWFHSTAGAGTTFYIQLPQT